MKTWKLVRIMIVNLFYCVFLSILVLAMLTVAFTGNLLVVFAMMLFFPLLTGLCHEMHGCDNGMICRISKLFGRLNFFCKR